MRKTLGPILLGLGGFLLTTALLVWLWVPGQVEKTPLNVNSLTVLTGQASYLGSPTAPVKATSRSVTNGKTSTDKYVVFDSFTCLMWNKDGNAPTCESADVTDTRLINASTDRFATDRHTAVAVDPAKLPNAAVEDHDNGLVNKFPFGVEKKTYKMWDGLLGRSVDVNYQGTDTIDGFDVYKFAYTVDNEAAEISSGVQGTYSTEKTYWVDPTTGSFIKQSQKEVRSTADGTKALDLDLTFDDATVKKNISDAKANDSKLGLVHSLPLWCFIAGLLALLGGFLLGRGARTDRAATPDTHRDVDATEILPTHREE